MAEIIVWQKIPQPFTKLLKRKWVWRKGWGPEGDVGQEERIGARRKGRLGWGGGRQH